MDIIAEWKIIGMDGSYFTFDVYSIDDNLLNLPKYGGVYILSYRKEIASGEGTHEILFIGTTDSIHARINNYHEKWQECEHRGMNAISVYPVPDEITRRLIKNNLVEKYNPRFND